MSLQFFRVGYSMLIVSRHRQETDDSNIAPLLAAKLNTVVWSIPLLYDLPSDSPIIRRLQSLPEPAYFLVPLSERVTTSILNQLQIPYAGVFETADVVQIPDGGISGGQVEFFAETP
ncbi:MAG: hypothetical protein LBI05_00785, partial [Planctomycetaceae bacterium]|nr:hypothetical protein [Planctomycetaceae bacterium]